MAARTARAKPADTRIDGPSNDTAIHDGPIDNGANNGMTGTIKLIKVFAFGIEHLSRQALDRTTQHIEKLRKVKSREEVTSMQLDFVKESLLHAAKHTGKLCEMLATVPIEMAETDQDDLLHLVTAAITAVQTTEAAGRAAAAKVERLTEVASNVQASLVPGRWASPAPPPRRPRTAFAAICRSLAAL